MKTINSAYELQAYRKTLTGTIGFVPTMGAFHQGHISLFETAKKNNDVCIASIFVNPTQFDDKNDFTNYPNTLQQDLKELEKLNIDCVFLPNKDDIYPDGYKYKVTESEFSQQLCGAHRPGHFDGVLTIVLKLLLITEPTTAYFGEKDFQQYLLIKNMAHAFFLKTKIESLATVREHDGLAMSSRNALLTKEQREVAPLLYKTIKNYEQPEEAIKTLEEAGFKVDYVEEHFHRRFAAARLGSVRLIDNVKA